MPLLTTKLTPPGGFTFKEPKTKWSVRDPMLPFEEVVRQIMRHREANVNHFAKTDLDYDAIADALEEQVCHRLKFNSNWCRGASVNDDAPPVPLQNEPRKRNSRTPRKRDGQGCATCGRRKKRS